jgi:hypothetical protein
MLHRHVFDHTIATAVPDWCIDNNRLIILIDFKTSVYSNGKTKKDNSVLSVYGTDKTVLQKIRSFSGMAFREWMMLHAGQEAFYLTG